jgi:gas vesicle protein
LKKVAAFPEGGNDMNQRDGFTSGFLTGTIVGGLVGGVLGALLASQRANESTADIEPRRNANLSDANNSKGKRRQLKASDEASIEAARRSLEDKIAKLNETIDEVRLTLGDVNRNQQLEGDTERLPTKDT